MARTCSAPTSTTRICNGASLVAKKRRPSGVVALVIYSAAAGLVCLEDGPATARSPATVRLRGRAGNDKTLCKASTLRQAHSMALLPHGVPGATCPETHSDSESLALARAPQA